MPGHKQEHTVYSNSITALAGVFISKDVGGGKGIFDIPKGSADTHNTNARTGKHTRRIKQTLMVQGLKKSFPQSQTEFQIFFCTASSYKQIYHMTFEYAASN